MKTKIIPILTILVLPTTSGFSQGFINLGFEQADVSGYPVNSSDVPVASAFPGWEVLEGGSQIPQVWYDGTSAGGNLISIWDANTPGTDAIQGQYSAALFASLNVSSSISQTGTVPIGTESLLFDMYANPGSFTVTLGGETLSLTPLGEGTTSHADYPYTLYGANISSFAGLSDQQLTFTSLAGGQPNEMILDNIQFSPSQVPEPGALGLSAVGGLFLVWRRGKALAI
jgi:hypothetical protein